jgi:hypothetical protein
MVVSIAPDVFQIKDNFDSLDKLIDVFLNKRHQWSTTDPEAIFKSEWLKGETNSRLGSKASFLIKQSVQSLYLSKRSGVRIISIVVTPTKVDEYDVHVGLKCLLEPLYIIVENLNSDRNFLVALFHVFNYKDLTTALENGWIQFDSEGGAGGTIRRIDLHCSKKGRPNILTLLDSDLQSPDDDHNDQIKEICKKCSDNGIKAIVLKKRAIENYIPIALLEEIADHLSPVVEAYKSLTDEQKDFYDLKKGFGGKGDIPDNQKDLFADINKKSDTFKSLRNGFNVGGYNVNNLHHCFLQKDKMTKEMLLKRCVSDPKELENLLNEIKSLI